MKIRDISKVNNKTFKAGNSKYINYLDTGSLRDNNIIELKKLFFDTDIIPSRAKRIVNINNILFSSVRPNQCHYGIYKNQIDNLIVSTGFIVLEIDEAKANPDFVYYCLTSEENMLKLQTIAENSTSAYPSIVADDILNLEIKLPSLRVQNSIADLLMKIEKKILLNNKINDNLYKQLDSIYNFYFNSSKDKLKKQNVGSILDVVTGKEDANFAVNNGDYKFFTCSNKTLLCNKPAFDGSAVLIAGNGDFNVKHYTGKFNAYQRTYVLLLNDIKLYAQLYMASKSLVDKFKLSASGSIVKFITKTDIENIQVCIDINDKLSCQMNNLLFAIESNNKETDNLTKIRNFLLPLLINGQATIS